jgi:CheY-like chemotaxis protein
MTTSNIPIPPPILAESQPPAHFDPFWNTGKACQSGVENPSPHCEVVVAAEALEALRGLAEQFQEPAAGWKAFLLAPPTLNYQDWATPTKLAEIASLVPNVVPLERSMGFFLLPNNRVVVVLYYPDSAGLVKLVYGLVGLLVAEDQVSRTTVTLADLSKHPERLKEWAMACEKNLKSKASMSQVAIQQNYLTEVIEILKSSPFNASPALNNPKSQRAKPVVLVVEDDPSTSHLLENLLSISAQVVVAYNARDAAKLYPRYMPDLVLMDIGLPDVDGLSLLQALLQAHPTAYVVMLTANATQDNLATASQVGSKGFLAKPFTREKLQQALNQATTKA